MLSTHYVKRSPRNGQKLTGELQSVIYGIIPSDSLFTKAQLLQMVKKTALSRPNEFVNINITEKDIVGALQTLVDTGFVKEIYFTKLERFIETL